MANVSLSVAAHEARTKQFALRISVAAINNSQLRQSAHRTRYMDEYLCDANANGSSAAQRAKSKKKIQSSFLSPLFESELLPPSSSSIITLQMKCERRICTDFVVLFQSICAANKVQNYVIAPSTIVVCAERVCDHWPLLINDAASTRPKLHL